MTPQRIDLSEVPSVARDAHNEAMLVPDMPRVLIHLRGYYGNGGETEGVLSIGAELALGRLFPESARVWVGSPKLSPLIDGYLPSLGFFSCSPDAADALADELRLAAAAAREAMATEVIAIVTEPTR
jgi:hypothetical protein